MLNGNDIFISRDENGAPIASTRSNEIISECEIIEKSSPTIGRWRKYISGRKGWSFTTNWLVTSGSNVTKLLNVGTRYFITVYSRATPSNISVLTGYAICTKATITSTCGSIAKGTFSFIGCRNLVNNSVPVTGIILDTMSLNLRIRQVNLNPVTATVMPANASHKAIEWTTDNPAKLLINQEGDNYTLQGVAIGSCNLIAKSTDGTNVSASCGVQIYQ